MTKIVLESGLVINLGGYLVECLVKPDYVDVVVGNPLKEDVKIDAPILRREMLDYMLLPLAVGVLYSLTYLVCAWGLWGLRRWALWGEIAVCVLDVLFIVGYFILAGFSWPEFGRMAAGSGIILYLFRSREVFSVA